VLILNDFVRPWTGHPERQKNAKSVLRALGRCGSSQKEVFSLYPGFRYREASCFTKIIYQMSDRCVKWKINVVVIFR